MKFKSLLLTTAVLGSFSAPIVNSTAVLADTTNANDNAGQITPPEVVPNTPDENTLEPPTIVPNEPSVQPPSISEMPKPQPLDGYVGTLNRVGTLYELTDNGFMHEVPNRVLESFTDWKVAGTISVDGENYYQVSSNEWVKASEVYRYEYINKVITTKATAETEMVQGDLTKITNRVLEKSSDWMTDRIAFLGNGTDKYYRVSTNEFVSANDVTVK